jgi:thioredoxin reductase (NADPH)
VLPIVRHGPGQFTREAAQLSSGIALVDAEADDDLEALLIPPDRLRALIVAEAELGERIVRALILRSRCSHRIRWQRAGIDWSTAISG